MLGKLRDILGNLPSAGSLPLTHGQLDADMQLTQMHDPEFGITFWRAAAIGDSKVLSYCMDNHLIDVNATDFSGRTALIHAASNGQINTTALLLQNALVDVNIEDAAGKAALCYAIENRNSILVMWLLTRDTDQHIVNKALMMAFTQFCQSQLHPDESKRIQACQLYESLISALLNYGANPLLGGLREAAENYPRILSMLIAASKMFNKTHLQQAAEIKVEKLQVS